MHIHVKSNLFEALGDIGDFNCVWNPLFIFTSRTQDCPNGKFQSGSYDFPSKFEIHAKDQELLAIDYYL